MGRQWSWRGLRSLDAGGCKRDKRDISKSIKFGGEKLVPSNLKKRQEHRDLSEKPHGGISSSISRRGLILTLTKL